MISQVSQQLLESITAGNIFEVLVRNRQPNTSVIGSLGTVEMVTIVERPEQRFVLKIVHLDMFGEEAYRRFGKQIQFLNKTTSPYFLKLYKYLQTKTQGYMLMELCQKGNLFRYQASCPNRTVPLDQALKICADVMRGLYQLHRNGLLHRNINLQNVFVFSDQENDGIVAKVADFGLSRTVGQAMTKKFSTEMFFAPELYTDEQYGHEVDVWALGVLLYHMISKVSPFYVTKDHDNATRKQILINLTSKFTFDKFLNDTRASINDKKVVQELYNIFSNIFIPQPSKRITMFDIMNHPLFDMHFMKHQELKELEGFYGRSGYQERGLRAVNVAREGERERGQRNMQVMSQQPNGFLKSKDFGLHQQLLCHRRDHIELLAMAVEHFQTSQSTLQIAVPQLTCMLYNLSLYYFLLLQKFTQTLTLSHLQSSYPQYHWFGFVEDVKFHQFSEQCKRTLEVWRRKYEWYERQCWQVLKDIGKKNRVFVGWWGGGVGKVEKLKGLKEPLEDEGFKMAFRCSTVLCHNQLKQQLQSTNPKGNKLYFSATIILICHAFNNIFRNYRKDMAIFSQFIDQERNVSNKNLVHSQPVGEAVVFGCLAEEVSLIKLWKWLTERSVEQLTTVMKAVVKEYFDDHKSKAKVETKTNYKTERKQKTDSN